MRKRKTERKVKWKSGIERIEKENERKKGRNCWNVRNVALTKESVEKLH